MSNSGRWSLAALVAVVALIVALWPRGDDATEAGPAPSTAVPATDPAQTSLQTDAALAPCPVGEGPGAGPMAGIALFCLGNGDTVDMAAALAGTPALVNLWAYWCAPCAHELPVLQEFATRAGSSVTVLTVHSDRGADKAIARLRDLAVVLPGVQDGSAQVRTAVGAPAVLPVSVLVRPDGSIAKVIAKPFESVDEIAAAVADNLGVTV